MTSAWYFVDVETYTPSDEGGLEPTLNARAFSLGCVIGPADKPVYFTDPDKMLDYLLLRIERHRKKGQRTYIYGHNHQYDFISYTQNRLVEMLKTEQLLIVRGKPFFAIWNRYGYFLDTMAFYPMSLEKAGEMAGGIGKGTMPERVDSVFQLHGYLEQDVRVTKHIMWRIHSMIRGLGYPVVKWTTPGNVAVSAWKHHLKQAGKYDVWFHKGQIHGQDTDDFQLIRRAYKGGRCEAFAIGEQGEGVLYDAHAFYWRMMQTGRYPDLRTREHHSNPEYSGLRGKIGVAACTIRLPAGPVGLLPVWQHIDGDKKVLYPRHGCTVTGTWALPEIDKAVDYGAEVVRVEEAIIYRKDADYHPFRDFIGKLWALRQEANPFDTYCLKLLGNSLYGKFGQRKTGKDHEWVERKDVRIYQQHGWTIASAEDDYLMSKPRGGDIVPKHAHPMIAVLVNAYARMALLNHLMLITQVHIDGVLYCDTDGIIVREHAAHLVQTGNDLGDLREEARGETYIRCEKHYSIGEKVVLGGVPRSYHKPSVLREDSITVTRMVGVQSYTKQQFSEMGTFKEQRFTLDRKGKPSLHGVHTITEDYDDAENKGTQWGKVQPTPITEGHHDT